MNQLLTKIKNAPIENFYKMPKIRKVNINVPKKANNFSHIKFLKENKSTVDIITFYTKEKENKPGEILKRYFITSGVLGKQVIEKNYIKLKDVLSQDNSIIKGRKVISRRSLDGENIGKAVEIQAITDRNNDMPVLNISKIKSFNMGNGSVKKEMQTLCEYQNGMKPKGFKIFNYYRTGKTFLTDIIEPSFKFINISKQKQDFMKNDPYLLLHLHKMKNFKKLAPSVAINPEHKLALPFGVRWFTGKDDILGYCTDRINLNHHNIKTRNDVIKISAHENEHAYQKEQALFYAFEKNIKNPKVQLSEKTIEHYRKFWESDYPKQINSMEKAKLYYNEISGYTNPAKNLKKYENQIIEKEAIEASAEVYQQYLKSLSNLKEEFPYAPDYMLGYSPLN